MKKQKIKEEVKYNFNWTYGVSIDTLITDLAELKHLGVTEIEIEPYESYGSAGVEIKAFIERLETDEEVEKRIQKENEWQESIRNRKLKEYEKLKTELGL